MFFYFYFLMARKKSNYCSFCGILWLSHQNIASETDREGCLHKVWQIGLTSDHVLFSSGDSRAGSVHSGSCNHSQGIWELGQGALHLDSWIAVVGKHGMYILTTWLECPATRCDKSGGTGALIPGIACFFQKMRESRSPTRSVLS